MNEQSIQILGGPLDLYAETLLRIKPKVGPKVPFRFKPFQVWLEQKLEKQREETGMVRALILKGRKMGSSTYVAGRFFRRAHVIGDTNIYIFSHERDSSKTLFGIADTFWLNLPPEYRPYRGKATQQSMSFSLTGSSYAVGTAGSKDTGRSQTYQLFHGSEVAFWENAEDHVAGALQTVADDPGTEIILETTANGIGGTFYDMWQKAERGQGDYIAIFIPWFWDDDYRRPPPKGWRPEGDEAEYRVLYDLDLDQAYWFHLKNLVLGGRPGTIYWKTRQEYPANAQEAFQSGGEDSLIRSELVMRARRFTAPEPAEWVPLIMGVDLARGGDDRTRLMSRRGRVMGKEVNREIDTDNEMTIVHHIATEIDEHGIDMTFIDVTGMGGGVVARLHELGYGDRVMGINFGSQAPNPDKYPNMRNYMWGEMADWFADVAGVDIPDDNTVHRHMCAPFKDWDSNSRLKLESKKLIKKRLKFSPDAGDAGGLTFAAKVARRQRGPKKPLDLGGDSTSWMRH